MESKHGENVWERRVRCIGHKRLSEIIKGITLVKNIWRWNEKNLVNEDEVGIQ